ncbi:hypothetical protein KMW28_27230 [Flammeovirga yaeyamensis]|uniref:Uncharacterized protein n=1 Tax=Flammeovirga yaeyamensis TaxID=367791 RepID=A0AAX1NAU0_9BACT|nr:hypothetical protein [Flammeovirga yaeyamensis]MBB3700026.1 hypothetical protein [Flammeovirga yaeyamensis]NMF37537.1 hypothetical protein [Flammeovirga yaeyamensis]QWG04594.1 hypothetical protein KMW28_27230 [Flammeovirga yaeyamensis]
MKFIKSIEASDYDGKPFESFIEVGVLRSVTRSEDENEQLIVIASYDGIEEYLEKGWAYNTGTYTVADACEVWSGAAEQIRSYVKEMRQKYLKELEDNSILDGTHKVSY